MEHITILGSGGFGLSLALSAYRSGHAVKVWSKFPEELEAVMEKIALDSLKYEGFQEECEISISI